MIKVTRINKKDVFWINEEKIESIEETPDTMITFDNGKKISVAESAQDILEMIDARKCDLSVRVQRSLEAEMGRTSR